MFFNKFLTTVATKIDATLTFEPRWNHTSTAPPPDASGGGGACRSTAAGSGQRGGLAPCCPSGNWVTHRDINPDVARTSRRWPREVAVVAAAHSAALQFRRLPIPPCPPRLGKGLARKRRPVTTRQRLTCRNRRSTCALAVITDATSVR